MTVTTCHIHTDRVAGAACSACGRPICPLCMVADGSGGFRCPCSARAAAEGPSMWRRNPVVDVLVFGIHAPCEAVWNVVACPEAAPLLGDCDAAAFRDGDVPGAGARVVQRYHTDGVSTREVEFTVEHWEPPHALVVSLPGEVTAYRFSPGPHGTSMTIEHRFVCPKGWRGGVQRRAAHQSQRRHGRAVRRLAESGWRPSPGSPGSLGG